MTDELERQVRAWVDDIDDPIPVDDVRLRQCRGGSRQQRGPIVLAAAAVLLLIAGVVAVLADSESSSKLETAADSADDASTTVPETSTAPTTGAPPEPTTSAPTATSSTTPERASRTGTVSEVVAPPDGEICEGLRSRTVWVSTGRPDEITATAGGWADYVETVTNEGTQTCTMVFIRCAGGGVLYADDGTRAPEPMRSCPADLHAPEDLPPGASRQETFTAELFTAPGDYELRVSQLDGRLATLPIRLEPQMPACDPGTLTLDQQPHESGASRNDTTFAQLFITATQTSCTVRITETRLTVRPDGDPDAAERTFIDGAARWYDISSGRIMADVTFGPIDLPPGGYDGVIAIQLESGETLRKRALLFVN